MTDLATIRKSHAVVLQATRDRGLFGLINNAGIAVVAPLEAVPISDLRLQLEVNVVGQVAVTQAFLPLVRQARGRIVNMGSIAGLSTMPLMGPYSASKFALEAITDALRLKSNNGGSMSRLSSRVRSRRLFGTSRRSRQLSERLPSRRNFEFSISRLWLR